MNDADRKFLTEAMGRGWNENSPCKNRTFTTWDDFGAIKDFLVRVNLWVKFSTYAFDKYYSLMKTDGYAETQAIFLWLIDPIHFPKLVVDFLKEHKS